MVLRGWTAWGLEGVLQGLGVMEGAEVQMPHLEVLEGLLEAPAGVLVWTTSHCLGMRGPWGFGAWAGVLKVGHQGDQRVDHHD